MMKRTISWIATVMLLIGLTCGAAPSAFAADTAETAQIGWIADFTDLTKWSTVKLDGTLASDLSSSDSTVNVAKDSVNETGFGATLFAGYCYNENGELYEKYANDYYLAYQKVTVDLDAYPYLYTKYTPGATDNAFQLGVSQFDPLWTGLQTGAKTKNLCQGDGVEIDGKYRRVNLKSALGVEGVQTFNVYMGLCYVNGAPWAMDYTFLGSDGSLQSDDAVAEYVKQLNPDTFAVKVEAQAGGTVSGGTAGVAAGKEITVKATADNGFSFTGWYQGETKVSDEADYTFTPTADVSLVAHFEAVGWSMDLSTQAAAWQWVGDHGNATHTASVAEVQAGTVCPLKFEVGAANAYGGKSLKATFDYEVAGAVFYQFLGTRLTVDVDKTPYLYYKCDFSKVDLFTMYLNDQEINGQSNGVFGDSAEHGMQRLDLKAHYGSGVHSFFLIAYFYDSDGTDEKPFTIEYCFTGTAEDAPSEKEPDSSVPSDDPSKPSTGEPQTSTLTDEDTGISISGEDIEEGMALRVNPIEEGDDYAFVQQLMAGKLSGWKAYDVSLTNFGIAVAPSSPVTMTMPVPASCRGQNVVVYRLADDGTLTKMSVTGGQDTVTFTADKLGLYAIGTDGAPLSPGTGAAAPIAAAALLLVSAGVVVITRRKKETL